MRASVAIRDGTVPGGFGFRLSEAMFRLLCLLLAVSLIATLPQTIMLLQGERFAGLEGQYGLRWLREAVTLIICMVLGVRLLVRRRPVFPYLRNIVVGAAVATYALIVVASTLARGYPWIVPLSGLRVFQYVPVAIVGYYLATHGREPLRRMAWFLIWYVAAMIPLALVQVFFAPPVHGRTFFGSRAFGMFTRPNVFGMVLATCMLWFMMASIDEPDARRGRTYRVWAWLAFAIILLAGSRTSMVLGILVLAFPLFVRLRDVSARAAVTLLAPIALFAAFALASLQALSGRAGTAALGDPRIQNYLESLQSIERPLDVVVGWGLGLTSNTLSNLVGYGVFEGQVIADSQYLSLLGGFGVIGLMVYLALLVALVRGGLPLLAPCVALFILLAGVPFNILEMFPANMLLLMLWGVTLGEGRARVPDRSPSRNVPA